MNFRLLLCCGLIMVLASVAMAQRQGLQDFSVVQTEEIAAGIRRGESTASAPGGMRGIEFVELDLNTPMVSLECVIPLDGPMDSDSVRKLGESVDALSVIGLDPRPTADNPGVLSGLRLAQGEVYSWPPKSQPHVLVRSDGGVEIVEPPSMPGVISFDDGTSLTLKSINGALPVRAGEASVYTGRLRSDEPPVAAWTRTLIASEITPLRRNANPHTLFLGSNTADRRFRPSPPQSLDEIYTGGSESLLILPEGTSPAVLARLQERESFQITISLKPRESLASAVFPLKRFLARDGQKVESVGDEEFVCNALGLDTTGRRLTLLSAAQQYRGAAAIPVQKMVEFAASEGFPLLAEIPGKDPLLLASIDTGVRNVPSASAQVRLALAVCAKPPTLEIPGTEGEFYPIIGVIVEDTRREFSSNYARALRDGKTGFDTSLDTFWAATFLPNPMDNENTLRILPPRPMNIAAVELVHAESAGFSPDFNVKHFRIDGRESREDDWMSLVEINHEEPVARERIPIPDTPRLAELRIEILEPSFIPGGQVMRLAELSLWSPEESVE